MGHPVLPYDAGRAQHPHGHPVLVKLGDGCVENVGDELAPGWLQHPRQVGVRLVAVVRHDLLAVHGEVVLYCTVLYCTCLPYMVK